MVVSKKNSATRRSTVITATPWLVRDGYVDFDWIDSAASGFPAYACGSAIDALFAVPETAKCIRLCFSETGSTKSYVVKLRKPSTYMHSVLIGVHGYKTGKRHGTHAMFPSLRQQLEDKLGFRRTAYMHLEYR